MTTLAAMKETMKERLDCAAVHQDWTQEADCVRLHIYTSEHRYNIVGVLRNGDFDYLGCTYMLRKCLPGENWNRGGDLADGPFCKETWDKIMSDIVRNEVVKISAK